MSLLARFSQDTATPETSTALILNSTPETNERKKYKILEHEITEKTDLPPLEPIIRIADGNFAYRGDISFISGAPKSGKSNVLAAMIASCFTGDTRLADTLNISSTYADNKPIIYIDTEQPKQYTKGMIKKVLDICGMKSMPENLHIFNLREFSIEARNYFLQDCFEHFKDEHLYLIDGITDFISSVNDDKESGQIINYLMGISSQKQIPIVLVLHENPGSQKSRGHIGSESDRKGGGSIGIRKDREKGVHWIEAKFMRGSKDFENVYFRWEDDVKRFQLIDETELQAQRSEDAMSKEAKKILQLTELFQQVFNGKKELHKFDIKAKLLESFKLQDKTAGRRIKEAFEFNILELNMNNDHYFINPNHL